MRKLQIVDLEVQKERKVKEAAERVNKNAMRVFEPQEREPQKLIWDGQEFLITNITLKSDREQIRNGGDNVVGYYNSHTTIKIEGVAYPKLA